MTVLNNEGYPFIDITLLPPGLDAGVIVPMPSGYRFVNQTGGVLCHQREATGDYEAGGVPAQVRQILWDTSNGLTAIQAHACDLVLRTAGSAWRVDQERLRESEEAWLHVTDAQGRSGIMVWKNSD